MNQHRGFSMNIQMMVQTNHESISPQDSDSITIDTRVVNALTTATISSRQKHIVDGIKYMEQFVIEGGNPLSGTIKAGGNKNAAIKMIPACLLTEEPVILHNMPQIGDVLTTLDIMRQLGASVDWLDDTSVRIHAQHINATEIDPALAGKIRASIVFAGPMLARMGRIRLPI